MVTAEVIQKEACTLKLTLTDKSDSSVIDVSTATITLYCKDELNDSTTYQFQVDNADIDKSLGESGIISIPITATQLDFYGTKYCILKLYFDSSNIRKIIFKISADRSPE